MFSQSDTNIILTDSRSVQLINNSFNFLSAVCCVSICEWLEVEVGVGVPLWELGAKWLDFLLILIESLKCMELKLKKN